MSSTEKNSADNVTESSSILFLSDVHLGGYSKTENRKLEKDVIDLVSYCEKNDFRIIILGDLFEYWMEYPGNIPPIGTALLNRFQHYHRDHTRSTLYVTGNHDNWTYGYLSDIGFDIEHEYRMVRTPDCTMMVMHGDGLRDSGMNFPRPLLHRVLRNSYFVKIYQTLFPPSIGWKIMKQFSLTSKSDPNDPGSRKKRALLDNWAQNRVTSDSSIQAIVYGHHHKPLLWNKDGNICLNCGSFADQRTVGLYTNRKFQIVTWNAGRNKLIPS